MQSYYVMEWSAAVAAALSSGDTSFPWDNLSWAWPIVLKFKYDFTNHSFPFNWTSCPFLHLDMSYVFRVIWGQRGHTRKKINFFIFGQISKLFLSDSSERSLPTSSPKLIKTNIMFTLAPTVQGFNHWGLFMLHLTKLFIRVGQIAVQH